MTNSQANQFNDALSTILTEGLELIKEQCSYRASDISLDSLSYGGLKDEYWGEIPCFEADAFEELQDIVGYYEDLETAKADKSLNGESLTKLQESVLIVHRADREEEVNNLFSSMVRETAELKHWKKKCGDAIDFLWK